MLLVRNGSILVRRRKPFPAATAVSAARLGRGTGVAGAAAAAVTGPSPAQRTAPPPRAHQMPGGWLRPSSLPVARQQPRSLSAAGATRTHRQLAPAKAFVIASHRTSRCEPHDATHALVISVAERGRARYRFRWPKLPIPGRRFHGDLRLQCTQRPDRRRGLEKPRMDCMSLCLVPSRHGDIYASRFNLPLAKKGQED